jgi:beta-glucosidase
MEVALRIPVADLQKWDMKEKRWKLYEGEYRVVIGSHSQDRRLESNMHYKASKKK